MRRLNRSRVTPPPCLDAFQHGRDTWNDQAVVPCKSEVRARLEEMQGRRCAYCEADLDTYGQHIEHFHRKHLHPERTFDWTNLFWSCDRTDSCGHYKDLGAGHYDVENLINPCEEDPDEFLRFRSDGRVEPRPDRPSRVQHRARETIRVFNLDLDERGGRSLRKERSRALEVYKGQEPDILAILEEFPPEERADIIQEEIARTSSQPFSTVIRHFFQESA